MMKNFFQRQPYIQAEKKKTKIKSAIGYFSKVLFLKLPLLLILPTIHHRPWKYLKGINIIYAVTWLYQGFGCTVLHDFYMFALTNKDITVKEKQAETKRESIKIQFSTS